MTEQETTAVKPEAKEKLSDSVESLIGVSALISMAVAFFAIFFAPVMSLAASAYTFTAIASITIMNKKP